jgi:hypothetical protein
MKRFPLTAVMVTTGAGVKLGGGVWVAVAGSFVGLGGTRVCVGADFFSVGVVAGLTCACMLHACISIIISRKRTFIRVFVMDAYS